MSPANRRKLLAALIALQSVLRWVVGLAAAAIPYAVMLVMGIPVLWVLAILAVGCFLYFLQHDFDPDAKKAPFTKPLICGDPG